MVTTLLFDVGGVILTMQGDAWRERREALAQRLGFADSWSMRGYFFMGEEWQATKTGRMTDAQMWTQLLAPYGLTAVEQAAFVRDFYADEGVDPALRDLVAELKRDGRYRLAILSNASDSLERILAQFDIDHYFDPIFNSHRMGMAKPEPRIYQTVLAQLSAAPETVFFIDDQERNTQAATALGFVCHWFGEEKGDGLTAVARLRADLRQRNIFP